MSIMLDPACRIYKKLPEVTKKKEDEKKKLVSQTNRLKAEIFKKVECYNSHKSFFELYGLDMLIRSFILLSL